MSAIPPALPESTPEQVKQAIELVASKQKEWASLPAQRKLDFIRQLIETQKVDLYNWTLAACEGTGYDASNPAHAHLHGETFVKGPAIFASWLRSLENLYSSLAQTGKPPKMPQAVERSDGSYSVPVWPHNTIETVFAAGATGYIYTPKGRKPEQYNPLEEPAGVAGVLGAGNFDAPTDILDCLFMCNKVTVFKPNPVNQRTAAVTKRIFQPLIDAGYLAYVVGGIPVGTLVVQSPLITELVMTGSCVTYDAIVWGPGAKKPQPDEKNPSTKKLTEKPFKAELGSVNPYIVVPGEWSAKELAAQAEQLVVFKMFNNAHICASPQVMVTCKNWPQRAAFLAAVRQCLRRYPGTRPYYPNCDKSYAEQLQNLTKDTGADENKSAKVMADLVVENPTLFPNQQHPVFATDVPENAFVTRKEAFCPILAEVPLDTAPTAEAFLPVAVDYANNKVWGSLTCTMIVDSRTESKHAAVVEKAIDDLKFGAIGVNQWAGFIVTNAQLIWGAYPRHSPEDVQSGIGKMGNALCIKDPVKCVLRYPFSSPAMQKIGSPQATLAQARRVAEFYVHYNYWRLTKLFVNVLTGL